MKQKDDTIQAACYGDSYAFEEFVSDKQNSITTKKLAYETIEVAELELGYVCNLKCPLCTRNWTDAQHLLTGENQRPIEEIIQQLDMFPNLKTITIAGMVSEPTLYKEFFSLVEYAVARNVLFYVYTNGDVHDNEYWEHFGSLCGEKTLVYFTICGTTQELHEKYRIGSNLNTILDHHAAFKKRMKYKNDVLQYLIFEYNKDDYNNLEEIRSKFSRENSINTAAYGERFNLVNNAPQEVSMTGELKKKFHTINNLSISRFEDKQNCKVDCGSYKNKFVSIDNNGRLFPCIMHRIYNKDMDWDFDYTDILNAKYDFCHGCEKFTSAMIKETEGLVRMVEC